MYLNQIDIDGFRGIKNLSLDLNQDLNVFIGENRWGRSSLISALMLVSLDNLLYQCTDNDFYQDNDDVVKCINIRFTYHESIERELKLEHNQLLSAVAYTTSNQTNRCITYQIKAEINQGKILTEHVFLDGSGNQIVVEDNALLIKQLINFNPMIQLKNPVNHQSLPITNQPLSEYYTTELSQKLASYTDQFAQDDLERGIVAARALLEYYLVDRRKRHHNYEKKRISPMKIGVP